MKEIGMDEVELFIWVKSLGSLLIRKGLMTKAELIDEVESYRDSTDMDHDDMIDRMINQINRW